MADSRDLNQLLEQAEKEISYLKRVVGRMENRLKRQEKIDDMNRHQANWAIKQVEEARHRAEQANSAKMDFLANMSHEIRTPLNIVLGMGELLAGTKLNDNQKQYLQSLRLSGEHLLKLINDILEFSRIESCSIAIESAPFDLKELLDNVEEMGTHLAFEKGIGFSLELDQSLELNRVGDSRKIKQILFNLLSNGVKFTDSGHVALSVAGLVGVENDYLLFTVSDTGIGIPSSKQEVIFERFSQIEQDQLQDKSGVGLGLAISQRLVSAMGGQITIDSEVGKGSSFSMKLRLPCSEEAVITAESSSRDGIIDDEFPDFLRLLVVDDIYLNFEVIKNYLKDLPVMLDYAGNGREAGQFFVSGTYDAILMDIRMPIMGGLEAVKNFRHMENERDRKPTPMIAMTAHAFVEQEKIYLESGFDEVLSKPFSQNDLLSVLLHQVKQSAMTGQPDSTEKTQPHSVTDISASLTPLIPKVLDAIADEIEVIKKALYDNDHDTLKKTSHGVKGLAGFYGFARLSELLEHLEGSANKREYRTAQALADALSSHVNELRQQKPYAVDDLPTEFFSF